MHKLTIVNKDGQHIFLDDFELKNVISYELKSGTPNELEIRLKLLVSKTEGK